MPDKRSERKPKAIPFLNRLERDRQMNLQVLIEKARLLELEGFETVVWEEPTWTITGGRLVKRPGVNSSKATLNFYFSPHLGYMPLPLEWANLIKALVILRFHRRNQSLSSQGLFITAASYVAYEMVEHGLHIFQLTPEYLNRACVSLTKHYSDGGAYNLHKAIGEFAAYCDANALCNVLLNYKYSRMRRPEKTGGLKHQRLDDPQVLVTKSTQLVEPKVFQVLGELYQKVPKTHKYRFYILLLTLLACLGRRFSEISLLPNQQVKRDDDGRAYLEYFPRKASQGDVFTPLRRLFLPTEVIDIVEPVITELSESCFTARDTAAEMQRVGGPDLRFLARLSDNQRIYKEDLKKLGIADCILLNKRRWLRKNGYAFQQEEKIAEKQEANALYYTDKVGLIAYCNNYFQAGFIEPMHVDQHGKKYYLKDLLLVKHVAIPGRGEAVAHWVATQCTHAMMKTFIRSFANLLKEFTSSSAEVDFTSHRFRHTLNTLFDEGGLTDLLQARWFGRSNPRDTKAYQHTSREKRALMLREDIRAGHVGGLLVDQIQGLPVNLQDAVLNARVKAVHDVGPGMCIHNFTQMPCERHLQCSAECKDYVWNKGDEGRKEELKRQYAITAIARETAERNAQSDKPRKSVDWLAHNEKKLQVLTTQLADNGIALFDPNEFLKEYLNG